MNEIIIIVIIILFITIDSSIITDINVIVFLYHSASSLICRWMFHTRRLPHEIYKTRLMAGASVKRIAHKLNAPFGITVNSRDKTIFWTESCECCRHV